jgi:ABC-2 type transport system ATP-binding protein
VQAPDAEPIRRLAAIASMPPKVVVRDLRKRYGGVEAARGVSFEIQDGEVFGLLGPNGAGKTTTVECVIGLRQPDAGDIEVCGIDARRRPHEVKQRIGAALQTTALQEKITPREALALFGSFYRERADADQLLERFSLLEKAGDPFDSLSGGQRQRLALAIAFVNRPELVFLDEPTTGLDPQSRRELHAEIARMKYEGHTVLLTTHYIDEAEQLCDRIAIIDHGRIIAEGAPRELIARSAADPTISLATAQPIERDLLAAIPETHDLVWDGTVARFRSSDIRRSVTALMALLEAQEVDLTELQVRKATLEDVFIELTGTPLRD